MMIEELEAKRLIIQSGLDKLKTQEERNQLGQFATPSPLAKDILVHAKVFFSNEDPIKFLDPALGSGAFYAALQRVFGPNLITSATAFEIDDHYGVPAQEMWGKHGLQLTHGDFTQAKPTANHNLIICNPPYVRHHHLSLAEKKRLGERTLASSGFKLSGLAGLYAHFLLQSHAWMAPGAIAGWLIPSEFMDVNYGREVKRYLLEKVTLLQIHRFSPDDVQFTDALVSSAIVWFKNELPVNKYQVKFTFGGNLSAPCTIKNVNSLELAAEAKWTRFPTQDVRKLNGNDTIRLGEIFSIKRGLATGNNKFFLIDENEVNALNIPKAVLKPILPSPRYVKSDEIFADSEGMPTNVSRLYLLDPKMDEDAIRQTYPSLANYLDYGRSERVHEGYLCRGRKRWYDQEQREPAPIVCTYMGRSDGDSGRPFRFIRNRSLATAANSYLLMYPKPALQELIINKPDILDDIWRQLNLINIDALVGEGRVYGGGLHKLEPKELCNVPLVL